MLLLIKNPATYGKQLVPLTLYDIGFYSTQLWETSNNIKCLTEKYKYKLLFGDIFLLYIFKYGKQ